MILCIALSCFLLIEAVETNAGSSPESQILYDRRSELLYERIAKNGIFLWSGDFHYLKDGNLDNRTVTPSSQTLFTYNGYLMTSASGGENFVLGWDLNGRLTQGIQTAVEYNWDDRLRFAQSGSDWIQVKYDADGNRPTSKLKTKNSQFSTSPCPADTYSNPPPPKTEIFQVKPVPFAPVRRGPFSPPKIEMIRPWAET